MLADLQEATKSHRIQQEASNSQSSKDKMTVIVVEEADIVFDQDEGYVSGLQNLILSAKRPVILLTSDSSSPHLEKFRSPSQTLQLAMARPAISSACKKVFIFNFGDIIVLDSPLLGEHISDPSSLRRSWGYGAFILLF